jgi:Concanavalin A-like lectin/glucanases superfamily
MAGSRKREDPPAPAPEAPSNASATSPLSISASSRLRWRRRPVRIRLATLALCTLLGCGEVAGGPTDASTEATPVYDAPVGESADGAADATYDAGPPPDGSSGEDAGPDAGAIDASSDSSLDGPSEAADADWTRAALAFNGSSTLVTLPTADGGASLTAFTTELWFKTTAATGMLFEVYSSGAVGADRSTYVKNGTVCFYVYTPSYSEICTSATTYDDGVWHNVASTLGSSGQFLYVDGTLQAAASTVTSSAFNYATGLRLGYGYLGPNGPLTFLAGDIDEVRLWSVQRSAQDLTANRGHAIDPATPGLEGYWKLDESGSASIAIDSVTPPHNGTLVGFTFTSSPWITPGAF